MRRFQEWSVPPEIGELKKKTHDIKKQIRALSSYLNGFSACLAGGHVSNIEESLLCDAVFVPPFSKNVHFATQK
jgi:hypothetical protein